MSVYKHSGNISSLSSGRVSAPACKNKKGSITVEAALAIPIFFLAVVSLLYLMEITAIRTSVRSGLQSAGKQTMLDAYMVTAVIPSKVERYIIQSVGEERLNRSIVADGSTGLQCEGSYLSPATGIGKLTVRYKVLLPLPLFGVPPVSYEESVRIKAWNGYEKGDFGQGDRDTVYITENGIVYHRDYHCRYLDLSIRMVQLSEVSMLRNASGGKYYPCERCTHGYGGSVYITNTGDRYHGSLMCSGLKRTVYAVPLSEAIGKGACSKCCR